MKEQQFMQLVKEIQLLQATLALTGWDQQTLMPQTASDFRSEQETFLSQLVFERMTGTEMTQLLSEFKKAPQELSDLGKMTFGKVLEEYEKTSVLPAKDYENYNRAVSKAYVSWMKAREQKDFTGFKDSLSEIIEFQRQFITYWKKDEATNYDVLLNQYEPGMSVEILDDIFGKVRMGILSIVQLLKEHGTMPKTEFLHRPVAKEVQIAFAKQLASSLGFDFTRGRLDESVHPFMSGFNINDARLTSRWKEDNFQDGVFGVLHEQGHGQYEQNVNAAFTYTPLGNSMSMGMHESQSLFQEIMIGSNENLWKVQYPIFQEMTSGTFDDIELTDFFNALNKSESSLIRVEADKLTYILHIIIRYEIEKAIFNDGVSLENLPQLWNDKYEEYLGVRPENDLVGILQDIHWAGGAFGYFPSYALGFMYAAQMKHAMSQELNFDDALATGDYQAIKHWLDTKVRVYGASKKPKDVLFEATGENLNPEYLLNELTLLYKKVYKIVV
ncbi:MAG: carboxypeptidase M32 [Streptococcaceae bacterium]|jgi:carboxypeptidase Taq|nr:carboxypeptidase M32 [Streptococcaceae bacterium]